MIENGTYFLHASGSGWTAARFRNGKLVDTTEECNAATHHAANDHWADVTPSDSDIELSVVDALPIIREVLGDDVYPEMVIVTREAE